ncbi:hypothetical protein Misp04_20350 [Micromonospora sp. NBRC 101691]|nr:hypothetical protein Misp04_20350 [Micromonospora sp. NBRC 101691]
MTSTPATAVAVTWRSGDPESRMCLPPWNEGGQPFQAAPGNLSAGEAQPIGVRRSIHTSDIRRKRAGWPD